jgi:hypothetical protein
MAAGIGVLFLVAGLAVMTTAPLSGLLTALSGVALVLATTASGLLTRRVSVFRRAPGGAGVALGLLAVLAFVGALVAGPKPAPRAVAVLPTATSAPQAPPTAPPTTVPTAPPTTVPTAAPPTATIAPPTAVPVAIT